METDRYIAAIEIGSSKIIGAVGKLKGAGQIDVIALEQDKSTECVKYGIIQNLEETSMRIVNIVEKLERTPSISPRKISGVYVGLSGRGIRSREETVELRLPEETEISDKIINQLKSSALAQADQANAEVIDAVPRYYIIDGTDTLSPKGRIGREIKASFDIITCRPEMRRNIMRTLPEKTGIRMEGFVVTALATGQIILTPDEKRLGCMLVDLGAETCTVSIYKFGHLCYFATLPLGGRNITRDLTSLNLLEEKAEEIKTVSGNAIAADSPSQINLNGLKFSDVSNIIVARSEEIIVNILEQIEYAGLKTSDLPGGIICIGGGFKLNGMLDLLHSKSNLTVRRGALPAYINLEQTRIPSYEAIEVISILYSGATLNDVNCLEYKAGSKLPENGTPNPDGDLTPNENPHEKSGKEKDPKDKRSRFLSKIKKQLSDYFTGNEDNDIELE